MFAQTNIFLNYMEVRDDMKRSLKRGMIDVLIANIINLVFSLLTNFILPGFLSVFSYADIKTYQLYVTYAGFMHLGFIDGMYLEYGGKEFQDIDSSELRTTTSTLRFFQLLMTGIALATGFIIHDRVVLAFSLTLLPLNMGTCYKSLYQATGDFKKYGLILNISSIVKFIFNMGLIFFIRVDDSMYYIMTYAMVDFLVWGILEYYFRDKIYIDSKNNNTLFSFSVLMRNIAKGFFLMLGNFSSIILTSMDCWFVKLLLTTVDFARYSFAVSIDSFLNVAITPVTVTLYNYFCIHKEKDEIINIRKLIVVFSTVLIVLAFPAKFIVAVFISHYEDANNLIFLLFGAQLFNVVIKGVYINLYKARCQQNQYFLRLIAVIMIGFISNGAFYMLNQSNSAFAAATLFSSIIWFIVTIMDFKDVMISKNEIIYMFLALLIFLVTGIMFNAVIGMILYIIALFILILIFMRETLIETVHWIYGIVSSRK